MSLLLECWPFTPQHQYADSPHCSLYKFSKGADKENLKYNQELPIINSHNFNMWFRGDTEGEIRCQSLLHQLASWDQSFCENYCCGKEIMDQTVSEKFLMSHEVNLKCDKEPLENNQFLLLKLAPWNPICLRWLSCVTTSVTRICFERFLMQKPTTSPSSCLPTYEH